MKKSKTASKAKTKTMPLLTVVRSLIALLPVEELSVLMKDFASNVLPHKPEAKKAKTKKTAVQKPKALKKATAKKKAAAKTSSSPRKMSRASGASTSGSAAA